MSRGVAEKASLTSSHNALACRGQKCVAKDDEGGSVKLKLRRSSFVLSLSSVARSCVRVCVRPSLAGGRPRDRKRTLASKPLGDKTTLSVCVLFLGVREKAKKDRERDWFAGEEECALLGQREGRVSLFVLSHSLN